jgi:hypothetical protein
LTACAGALEGGREGQVHVFAQRGYARGSVPGATTPSRWVLEDRRARLGRPNRPDRGGELDLYAASTA